MAAIQIAVSLGLVWALIPLLGLSTGQALLFAFCLALSSTAVSVTVVQDIGESNTKIGRLVIGVLIAQDLAVAPMLLIIAGVGGGGDTSVFKIALDVLISIALLIGVILMLTRKKHINLPFADLLTTKKDLTPLAILGWCFAFALATGLAGLSPAFGAFLAGLIVGNSAQHNVALHNAEPIKVILMMAFFLSVGLLLEIDFLIANLPLIMLILVLVTFFKTVLNTVGLRMLGEDWKSACMCSLLLGQMGEFSFVMGAAALAVGIIDPELQRYLIAVTVLSLVTSPIYVDVARRMHEKSFKIKSDDKGFTYSLCLPIFLPFILLRRLGFRITRDRPNSRPPNK
jgi:CPA2 family monovalent cation:H+ antiporter-2